VDDRRSKSCEFLRSWLGKEIEVALKDSELIRRKLTGKIVFIGKNFFFSDAIQIKVVR